jgi:hypothetical protein
MKTLNENLERQLNIRCNAAFRRAVGRAAANEMSSSSDYGRSAILRQLREDGIDIATIIPADSVNGQRGAV